MSKTLFADWSANLAMGDEHEKSWMKKTTTELPSPISSLNLGIEVMLIKAYVQLAREEIIDA